MPEATTANVSLVPPEDLAELVRLKTLESLPSPLPGADGDPDLVEFYRLLGDYPGRPGKAVRGQTVILSAHAHAGDAQAASAALGVAVAIELFQAWALIHDDIEDGSEQRRGAPALHRITGVPIALNVGDALHAHMWRHLLSLGLSSAVLDEFGAMVMRTTEGQHLELSFVHQGRFDVSEDEYLRMVELKTAHYTVLAPIRLGALCAQVTPDPGLTRAALDLGVAFQVRDDVLNLTGEAAAYGKERYGDIYEGKRTLIVSHLLERASGASRDRLISVLGAARESKSAADVEFVIAQMREHGSLEYAQRMALQRGRSGLERLSDALAGLPGRAAGEALYELLSSFATRRA